MSAEEQKKKQRKRRADDAPNKALKKKRLADAVVYGLCRKRNCGCMRFEEEGEANGKCKGCGCGKRTHCKSRREARETLLTAQPLKHLAIGLVSCPELKTMDLNTVKMAQFAFLHPSAETTLADVCSLDVPLEALYNNNKGEARENYLGTGKPLSFYARSYARVVREALEAHPTLAEEEAQYNQWRLLGKQSRGFLETLDASAAHVKNSMKLF